MSNETPVVHSDPEILGGTPVFVGTRVPVKSLYDYLEAGDSLDEFLESFPSVTRAQAIAALELARSKITGRGLAMSPSLSELLKLPAGERAELAMALWESLSEAEREDELELTPEQAAQLDRRWMEHVQRPESSIPWDEVRRKLMDRE